MCDADLILELPTACLVEVFAQTAHRRVRADRDINVISIRPTDAEVASIQAEIGVRAHPVAAAGMPLLFVLAGDYKIPLRPEVPCAVVAVDGAARAYQFEVLGLLLQLVFRGDGATSATLLDHFESLLVHQRALVVPQSVYVARAPSASPSSPSYVQPQWAAPDKPAETSTTEKVVTGLNAVGSTAASGLRSGAMLLAQAITSGAQYVVGHTDKTETAVAVPQGMHDAVKTARFASKGAVKVSATVARSLVGVTSVVSDVIANQLRGAINNEEDSGTMKGAKAVGLATADTAVSVFEAATDAARTILTAACSGICQVVDHKLGSNAGNFVENSLGLVQDAYDVSKAAAAVGTSGIVKQALHATAVKTLEHAKP